MGKPKYGLGGSQQVITQAAKCLIVKPNLIKPLQPKTPHDGTVARRQTSTARTTTHYAPHHIIPYHTIPLRTTAAEHLSTSLAWR